jgi:hypothetical protein
MANNLDYDLIKNRSDVEVRVSYELNGHFEPLVEKMIYRYSPDGRGTVQIIHPSKGLVHSIMVGSKEDGHQTLIEQVNNRLKELGWNKDFVSLEDLAVSAN